jgi:hypothetical protein
MKDEIETGLATHLQFNYFSIKQIDFLGKSFKNVALYENQEQKTSYH